MWILRFETKMNLRSVFTVEQQRILQRYYENGMTNQSKNCFQLILQCAQETKLDFSVVRTWVGNKRRKMSSKIATESGGIPPGTAPATPSMPPEAAVRNVVNIARSQSQQSSWSSSNNDVIVTGIYSSASSSGRPGAAKYTNASVAELHKTSIPRLPGRSDADFQQQHIPLGRQIPHCKNASLLVGEKTIILARQTSVLNSANSIYSHTKKSYGSSSVQTAELVLPQKPMICHRPCKAEPLGCQRSHKPEHAALASHVSPGPRAHPRDPACGTQNLEIREVFSLAVTDQPQRLVAGSTTQKHPSLEGSCLSIAMETGDVDDEYAREEELASMGAQIQSCSRYCEGSGSGRWDNQSAAGPGRSGGCGAQLGSARDVPDNLLYHSREFHLPARTSLHTTSSTIYNTSNAARSTFSPHFTSSSQLKLSQNQNNYQISGNLTVPWITGCSRKRALQDRTQFSDRDLATLKKYWDNGMTSLGSVCREKIEAVAAELNVDCEIVRTWIGNRRRKYRLMGIEVPPPRGGPADFSDQSEFVSKSALNPGEETATEVGDDNDRNDEVSICLSEGSSQEETNEALQNEEIGHKDDDQNPVSTDNVKIEILDDEESDLISNSEVDQMSSLLDYKSEEVRFIESQLENHKQKYFELQTFTRSLILAIKADDKEQQQALLSDLPPELEEMDFNHTSPEPDDTSFSLSSLSEKNASDSL
ncbi:highly divergent homeobox isoform X1 [Parus major]|uniref:highly divergent homeobox isoform X1 n=2 Tax=Parus major TaxID=9157 RepID=UPI0007714599|nr:highly divergent homeobox isoform X1 [Parus major]